MNPKALEFRQKLDGALIPAVPAPFDAEGNHDERAEKSLVQYHAKGPAAGVAVWVHTGRGLLLSGEERHRVFKRWRIGLRPDQFIVAGAGCPRESMMDDLSGVSDADYIRRATNMAQEAKLYGADAVLVYAPAKFRDRPDRAELIVDYHESIAQIGLPMILFYLYEAAGGVSYELPLLRSLLRIPEVAGIKVATLDSVMTFQDVARLVRTEAPEVALLTGEDRFLGYSLMRGAVGALIGMGAARPAPQAELIRAWREGRLDRFVRLSEAIDRFAEATFVAPMEGYIRRMMIALALDGVLPAESSFDPWGPPVPAAERKAISDALEGLRAVE